MGSASRIVAIVWLVAACSGGDGDVDAASGPPWFNDAGVPYCWNFDCPTDPGAAECGTCTQAGHDVECPPGFVCSCSLTCVRGPRAYDGGVACDAGTLERPDAAVMEWPACDMRHPPGT